jgi:hypothetical protein
LCLFSGLLYRLEIPLVSLNFCGLFFYLFRDLLVELLRVVQLPSRMSDGCLDSHELWFLRGRNNSPKQSRVAGNTVLALSSNVFSAFFIRFSDLSLRNGSPPCFGLIGTRLF